MFAAHKKLDKLIAITDWNGQQIDGPTDSVMSLGDLEAKWRAFGWEVIVADGHDLNEISAAYKKDKGRLTERKAKDDSDEDRDGQVC